MAVVARLVAGCRATASYGVKDWSSGAVLQEDGAVKLVDGSVAMLSSVFGLPVCCVVLDAHCCCCALGILLVCNRITRSGKSWLPGAVLQEDSNLKLMDGLVEQCVWAAMTLSFVSHTGLLLRAVWLAGVQMHHTA
jgi:hypothetical protein